MLWVKLRRKMTVAPASAVVRHALRPAGLLRVLSAFVVMLFVGLEIFSMVRWTHRIEGTRFDSLRSLAAFDLAWIAAVFLDGRSREPLPERPASLACGPRWAALAILFGIALGTALAVLWIRSTILN